MTDDEKMIQMSVMMPVGMKRALEDKARAEDRTMAAVIRRAIMLYLADGDER